MKEGWGRFSPLLLCLPAPPRCRFAIMAPPPARHARQTHRQHSAAVHLAMLSCSYAGCRQRQAMAALLNGGMLACKQHDSSGRTAFANSAGGTIRTAHDANARAIPPDALTALRSCACSRAELLLCRLQAYAKQWLPCPIAGCLPASSMTAVAVRRRDSERGGVA